MVSWYVNCSHSNISTEHKKDHELEDLAGCTNQQICVGNTLLTIFSNSCVGFFWRCGTAKQKLYRSSQRKREKDGWMCLLLAARLGGMAISHWGLACQLRSPKQEDEQTTEATIATSARRAAVNRQTRLDWNTGVIWQKSERSTAG